MGHIICFTSGIHAISAIDISGNNSIFTVSHNIALRSVGNSGLAGKALTILYGGDQIVALSGTEGSGGSSIGLNNYSALEAVDFINNNAGVNLNYATNFQSTGGDNGKIEIYNNSTLSGIFSAAAGIKVGSLVVTEGKSLVLDTNLNLSDTVTLQSNTTITVNPGFSINATYVGFYSDAPSTMLFGHNTTLNAEVTRVNGEMHIYTAANIIEFQGASNILKEINLLSGDLGSNKEYIC